MSSPWERLAQWRKQSDIPGDPWNINYFDTTGGQPVSPNTGKPYKRPVPDVERLIKVQKDLIKVLQQFDLDDTDAARTKVEAAYRSLNQYLRQYA
jgi:hypothetical protein